MMHNRVVYEEEGFEVIHVTEEWPSGILPRACNYYAISDVPEHFTSLEEAKKFIVKEKQLGRKPQRRSEMKIWFCKIGEVSEDLLPPRSDQPMREAIARAYERLTGCKPDFVFSGWGGELTEPERAVHEDVPLRDDYLSDKEKVTALRKEMGILMEAHQKLGVERDELETKLKFAQQQKIPVIGQEAICPDGLGRVIAVSDKFPHLWIQISTYVGDRQCKWSPDNVEFVRLELVR